MRSTAHTGLHTPEWQWYAVFDFDAVIDKEGRIPIREGSCGEASRPRRGWSSSRPQGSDSRTNALAVYEMIESLRREGVPTQLSTHDIKQGVANLLRRMGKGDLADRIEEG